MTTIRRAGARARLVEHDDPAGLRAAILALDTDRIVVDCVPAARTVLVTVADRAQSHDLERLIERAAAEGTTRTTDAARIVVIDVRYDGDDLAAVAAASGLGIDDVIRRHASADHRVEFFGFAPGFAYIGGVPAELQLPRRDTPRTRVDAGSVAIAGGQTVIYPGGTPGGWHVIGHTDVRLWDLASDPPNLLEVGDHVRFRATGDR